MSHAGDDDEYFDERVGSSSIYVRVVDVLGDGSLRLACGHVVIRRHGSRSRALCEFCFPKHYARARSRFARARTDLH